MEKLNQLHREDGSSEPEDESSESGNEGDATAQAAGKSFLDPRDLDLDDVRAVEDFCAATCECTTNKGGPCSAT